MGKCKNGCFPARKNKAVGQRDSKIKADSLLLNKGGGSVTLFSQQSTTREKTHSVHCNQEKSEEAN